MFPSIFGGSRTEIFMRILIKIPLPLLASGRPHPFFAWIPGRSQLLPTWNHIPRPQPLSTRPTADSFLCNPSALKPEHLSTPGKRTVPIDGQFQRKFAVGIIPSRECAVCAREQIPAASKHSLRCYSSAFNQHLPQLKWQGSADEDISGSLSERQ